MVLKMVIISAVLVVVPPPHFVRMKISADIASVWARHGQWHCDIAIYEGDKKGPRHRLAVITTHPAMLRDKIAGKWGFFEEMLPDAGPFHVQAGNWISSECNVLHAGA